MGLTNSGRNFIAQAIINEDDVVFFDSDNTFLGIGDSTIVFNETQTDLQASNNKIRKEMETGYPIRNGNTLTFKAVFDENEANFTWNEWGIFNAETGGLMLDRKVVNLGTKTTGVWSLTVSAEIEIGSIEEEEEE